MIDGLKARHRTAIIDILAANERVELAVLFGSRAMQTHTPTSDIDIALFGDHLTLTDQANLAAAMDDLRMAQRADLVLYKVFDDSTLREHIERHGVEWYRKPQSTTNTDLYLAPEHRLLAELVREHLPGDEVRAYGSRVSGRGHDDENLDLVLHGLGLNETPIDSLIEFENAVRDSNIPFQVEVRDWARLPGSFHRKIERDYVVIVEGTGDGMWLRDPIPQSQPGCESLGKNKFIEMTITKAVEINPTIKLSRGQNYAFVAMADLIGGITRVRSSNTKEFKGSGARFCHGDTLFARITPCLENGKIAKYLGTVGEIGFGSTEFIVFRGRDGITTTDYSHYLATDPKFRSFAISKMTGTSGRQRVPVDALESYVVQVPSIEQQHAIAHILGTLDDKIEVNRRMNATLEAMARTTFKDWFVNFGPTRAKAEGGDPYLASEVWDLFPDKLDGEGKPEGWERRNLATIADSPRRGVSPTDVAEETPYIGLEHMPRRSIALAKWEGSGKVVSNKSIFRKGEFLFGKLRPYFHKVGFAAIDGICSTDIVVVIPRTPEWAAFILACLSSDEFVDYTDQTSTGTKMPRTNWKAMRQYNACLPSEQVVRAFQGCVQPLIDRINANIHESRALTQTRDLLLPRLMSGKIRLHDVEKAAECLRDV